MGALSDGDGFNLPTGSLKADELRLIRDGRATMRRLAKEKVIAAPVDTSAAPLSFGGE